MLLVYEFGLNDAKVQKFRLLEAVVPVPLCLVPVPTCSISGYRYHLSWYQYQYGSVKGVPVLWYLYHFAELPRNVRFRPFGTNFLPYNFSIP